MTDYEAVPEPRFAIEQADGVEQIRVMARKQIFLLLFLPFWLTMWTIGGVVAIGLFIETHEPFLAFWLCAWAAGWVFAATTILWMLTGSETLRVIDGGLEIAHHLFGWSHRRLYAAGQVRNLHSEQQPWTMRFQPNIPVLRGRSGAVRFDYGGRTIYAASGLDAAEGEMIILRLKKRLPPSAQ